MVRLSVYRGFILADRGAGGPLDLVLEELGSSRAPILIQHLLTKGLLLKRWGTIGILIKRWSPRWSPRFVLKRIGLLVRHRVLDATVLSRPILAIRLDISRLLLVAAVRCRLFFICVASISLLSRFVGSSAILRFHFPLDHLFTLDDRLARLS